MNRPPRYRAVFLLAVIAVSAAAVGSGLTDGAVASDDDTITVDKSGGDYETIQAAVDNASRGDTIRVAPGTYRESVYVGKSVTLTAPNGATIANTTGDGSSGSYSGIYYERSARVDLSGFELTGWTEAIYAFENDGGDATIRDVTISDSGYSAIGFVGGSSSLTVEDVRIEGAAEGINVADSTGDIEISETVIRDTGDGIDLEGISGTWTIEATTVRDTTADLIDVALASGDGSIRDSILVNSGDGGLKIEDSTGDLTIRDTTITSVDEAAINADNTSGTFSIRDTTVNGTNDHGIMLGDSSGSWKIEDTRIRDVVDAGIDAFETEGDAVLNDVDITGVETGLNAGRSSGEWRVDGVTIGDAEFGLKARGATGNWTVRDSTITGVELNAIHVPSVEATWQINRSVLTGGDSDGVYANGSATRVDASYNYWGAEDGPAGDFDGSGGTASGNVTVTPYYTDEALTSLDGDGAESGTTPSQEQNTTGDTSSPDRPENTIPITDAAPDDPGTTLDVGEGALRSITFDSEDAEGTVTVEPLSDRPDLPGDRPVVAGYEIDAHDMISSAATIEFVLSQEQLDDSGIDPDTDDLVVLHGRNGGYDRLETEVVEADDEWRVLANTSSFSPFIVTTDSDEQNDESTDPDEQDDESTDAGGPGFGFGVALVAVLAATLLARQSRP